ncbi:TonB-dependent receptor [Bacteroidales bacterium OttesenSCG-928-C19]|nr:TonB-dependent receptor [Bacteroidales bacterium OttesenSCG-928-C19]
MKKYHLTISLLIFQILFTSSLLANEKGVLTGTVYEVVNKKQTPLPFANVFWLGTTKGTTTNENGSFSLKKPSANKESKLVISFIGYQNDTIAIPQTQDNVTVVMKSNAKELEGVTIAERLESSYISKLQHQKSEVISSDGLCRLACCNLAESFENSATIDVGYSDAVSGARQIQMLGLSGIYSQLMLENIPFIRGLSAPFGLNYVPGSFMDGIQISKGVSSVTNGYESMTGQINLEYRKPKNADRLFVNAFFNSELKSELNVVGAHEINDKLSTMVLAHGSYMGKEMDHIGDDGFMDYPKSYQINLVNRWQYDGEKYRNVSLINYVKEERTGGQMGFKRGNNSLYGIGIDNQRLQFSTKNGYMLNEGSSVALQLSGTYFEQKAFYGKNNYDGREGNLYANLIYDNNFSGNNKITTGINFQLNDVKEDFTNGAYLSSIATQKFKQTEVIPGVYAQYTGELSEKFSFIAGARYDYNSEYGSLFTPRVHLKWNIFDDFTVRAAAGKGYRTPYVLAENFGYMASSREFVIGNDLDIEDAWNYGVNFVKEFKLPNDRKATFTMDYYRTDFKNQIVVDMDKDLHQVLFYNLDGKSYSNSLQADLTAEVLNGFNVTLAGRYNDVKQTINGKLVEKPYVNKWKGLLVLSYATKYDKWIFDLTTQWNGSCRIPNTDGLKPERSDAYFFLLGQVTRKFKHLDIYAGCENITNYVQKDPIIAANEPFGSNFDASVIYAPMMGRVFYIGLRWTLK